LSESGAGGEGLRSLVDREDETFRIRDQCDLLGLNRSTYYYTAAIESEENLQLMRMIDRQYLETPFYGSRRMAEWLKIAGYEVNRKRVQRLMQLLDLEAIYPKRRTTLSSTEHRKYPYLLRGVAVDRPNQVWASDITYVPLARGFMYLVAIIDWHSRCVLCWRLSNSLEGSFCLKALDEALSQGRPEIFNTDQGVQFTSSAFTKRLEGAGVQVSMDGKGRALDNVFVERLWWSVKYEHVYRFSHETVQSLHQGLKSYLTFFNRERLHQNLGYATPWDVYRGKVIVPGPEARG
jgi:putative transposase